MIVADLQKSIEYYEQKLGFKQESLGGHVHMSRGAVVFILHPVSNPEDMRPNSSVEGGLYFDAFCYTNGQGVRLLYEEFEAAGVTFTRAVEALSWNDQFNEFTIKDLNGYCITFGGKCKKGWYSLLTLELLEGL